MTFRCIGDSYSIVWVHVFVHVHVHTSVCKCTSMCKWIWMDGLTNTPMLLGHSPVLHVYVLALIWKAAHITDSPDIWRSL
jgi:hypothetical protein